MLLEDLGKRIRFQRERLGLKQQDIANALQISPQAVSKWERGENGPDIAVLGALARLLGVTTDWLLGAVGEGRDTFEATVLVTSVNGAYEKSLRMSPKQFASWANGVFNPVTDAVLEHDGVPIKYMGDAFLAFFSGLDHTTRACRAAFLAKNLVAEELVIGLSFGRVYLGAVGHPDYARPDIMGEVVNLGFLVRNWAETNAAGGIAATREVVTASDAAFEAGEITEVTFRDIPQPAQVCEITARTS